MQIPASVTPKAIAAVVLLAGAVRHLVWAMVPAQHAGIVSKGCGGAVILGALWLAAWLLRRNGLLRGIVAAVLAWLAFEEAQVVVFSAAYLIHPWPVPQGQALGSARVGLDLHAISLFIVAVRAWRISSTPNSLSSSTKPSEPRQ